MSCAGSFLLRGWLCGSSFCCSFSFVFFSRLGVVRFWVSDWPGSN